MYGTVARVQVRAGCEDQVASIGREIGMGKAPGQITAYAYQMDSDPQEYFLVAVFEKNHQSPVIGVKR